MKDKLMLIKVGDHCELNLNVEHIIDIEYAYNEKMKKTHLVISMTNGKQHIFGSSEFAKYKIKEEFVKDAYEVIIGELCDPFEGVDISQDNLIVEEEEEKIEETEKLT